MKEVFEHPDQPSELPERTAELQELSGAEEEEVAALFEICGTTMVEGASKQAREAEWEIVQRFGERAVPFLLDHAEQYPYVRISNFLDTLVTERTAPLVLKAMQEKKVFPFDGALAAAAGKEKTAGGLAELLLALDLCSASGRSDHVRLLEALGEAGVDDVAPAIEKFYVRLRAHPGYARIVQQHLKNVGNDLYGCDAYDTIQTLLKINGPRARAALQSLADQGDTYVQPYIREALAGKLYIGEPTRWLIQKPHQEPEHYSYHSDQDLGFDVDEWSGDDASLDGEDNWRSSRFESLAPRTLKMQCLEAGTEWKNEFPSLFEEYWNNDSTDVRSFLSRLQSDERRGELATISEPKVEVGSNAEREEFARATLALFRAILQAPDYKAMREGADVVRGKIEIPAGYVHDFDRATESYFDTMRNLEQEDLRLPGSAQPFAMWHERFNRSRAVPPFVALLHKKLSAQFARQAFDILRGKSGIESIRETLRHTVDLFRLYRDVSSSDIPFYQRAAEKLQKIAGDRSKVFYGRDTDYFYYAVKAMRFGAEKKGDLKKIYINMYLANHLKLGDDEALRDRIMAYLLQEKISADAVHIDTGYNGSVPEKVLQALNPGLTSQEIDERIKLLSSRTQKRESVGSTGDADVADNTVGIIEGRPHHHGEITSIIRDEKAGKLRVVHTSDPWEDIKAWVVDQAIIRHFAPRAKAISAGAG